MSIVAQDGGGDDPPGGGAGGPEDDESGGDGTEGEGPESDSESEVENYKDVPCIVPPTTWGCVIRSGECDPGVSEPDKRPHILWSDQYSVQLYNLFVEVLGLESVIDMMGSTPEKACGTPDENIRCGENRMIHAIIRSVESTAPTPRRILATVELAKRGAKDAAMEKACEQPEDPSAPEREDCSKVKGRPGKQYRDTWHCAFAVNLFDGELATRFNAAWEHYAGNERAEGRDDPGMSPIRDTGGGYFICAAAQVTWECEAKDEPSEDPPPPEPEPEPEPEPDDPDGGDVPQPPDPGRFGTPTGADPPPPLEPAPSYGCKKRDKDGNEVPDPGEGDGKPAKCCYKSGSGPEAHCNNTGCWGTHQQCAPSADGTDCECVSTAIAVTRWFPERLHQNVENPDDPGDPPKWKYPKWNEELEREGKQGYLGPVGGGGTESGEYYRLGEYEEERSEMRSVISPGTLASLEDQERSPGGPVQSSVGAAGSVDFPSTRPGDTTGPLTSDADRQGTPLSVPSHATIPERVESRPSLFNASNRPIARQFSW